MGEAAVASIIGSKAWYESKLKRAKFLVRQMDEGYVELGFVLHLLHETPKNNDPKQLSVYETWGKHNNFGEFAEMALGLQRRKAERIRNVGKTVEVTLAAIPLDVKKRLIALGWTKLNELCRVFDKYQDLKTVLAWTEMAEKSTLPEVMRSVQLTIRKLGTLAETDGSPEAADAKYEYDGGDDEIQEEKKTEESEVTDVEEEEEEKTVPHPPSKKKKTVEQVASALPEPQRTKLFHFLCYDEQIDNVFEALERAEELAEAKGGEKTRAHSFLLSLICLDFLATNDFGKKGDPKTIKRYLKRLETSLGIKLIGVVEDHKIVYGEATVQKLMEYLSEQ